MSKKATPIVTITGPSGSGKTELVKILCDAFNFEKAISITTRAPREGEVDGRDYYFVTDEEFDRFQHNGWLAESVRFNHASYATTVPGLAKVINSGKTPVVIVEPNGVTQLNVMSKLNDYDIYSVFLNADLETLKERFLSRIPPGEVSSYDLQRLSKIEDEFDTWEGKYPYDLKLINSSNRKEDLYDLANEINESLSKREIHG